MGKIWLETTNGKLIHLPVVGDDVNSPDDPEKIPTSVITTVNRCWSDPIVIVHPTLGQITIDLRQDASIGSCNQCGQCCTHPVEACPNPGNCGWPLRDIKNNPSVHACPHLTILKDAKWGDAGNTECTIYADLINGSKGCLFPIEQGEMRPHMTSCGYSWS